MEQPVKLAPFFTPTGPAAETMIEKKSRFTGRIWPVETEEEALAHIKKTRDEFWDATHNVYAYIIKGGATRYSDDGEPGGTAGMPVLNVLRQAEISNVCCVVTRYFGGTLLGAGGLVRAYGRAAKLALDAAGISVQRVWSQVRIPCPYHLFERVRLDVAAFGGQVQDTDFAADVTLNILLPEEQAAPFLLRLQDLSGGKMQPEVIGTCYRAFPVEK